MPEYPIGKTLRLRMGSVNQKDKKIADIYLTILKEMAIQYGVRV